LGKVCEREEDSIHFHFYDPPSSIRYWIAESRPNKGPESVPTSIKKWNKGKTCSKLELKPGNGLMSFSSQLRVPSSKIPAAALTTSACSFRSSFPCFYYRFHGTLYYIISYTKAFSLPWPRPRPNQRRSGSESEGEDLSTYLILVVLCSHAVYGSFHALSNVSIFRNICYGLRKLKQRYDHHITKTHFYTKMWRSFEWWTFLLSLLSSFSWSYLYFSSEIPTYRP
jgi:hypothetical protein